MNNFTELLSSSLNNIFKPEDIEHITGRFVIPVNIVCRNEMITVSIEIPGIKIDSVKLDFNGDKLHISAEKDDYIGKIFDTSVNDFRLVCNEIGTGRLARCIHLPFYVTKDSLVSKSYDKGVLKLIFDKSRAESVDFSVAL